MGEEEDYHKVTSVQPDEAGLGEDRVRSCKAGYMHGVWPTESDVRVRGDLTSLAQLAHVWSSDVYNFLMFCCIPDQ